MAKSKQNLEIVDIDTDIDLSDVETDDTAKTGGRSITLTLEDGTEIKRADYIRQRADEGVTRGAIAKELTELQGKNVPYQVVFAATKNHPGYKKRAELAAEAAEASDDVSED